MLWFKKRPRRVRIEIRDGDCNILDVGYFSVGSRHEIRKVANKFMQQVLCELYFEGIDEAYWTCTEL
jgi:hypothetical protein